MYKALLLDDEKIVRLALKTMVDWNSLGFEISGSYGNAKTALESISGSRPDLIISDIVMPDMDGLSFIEQVRGMGITCPVIILTNHENFTYAVDALRLGVTDYVTKTDISPDSLPCHHSPNKDVRAPVREKEEYWLSDQQFQHPDHRKEQDQHL